MMLWCHRGRSRLLAQNRMATSTANGRFGYAMNWNMWMVTTCMSRTGTKDRPAQCSQVASVKASHNITIQIDSKQHTAPATNHWSSSAKAAGNCTHFDSAGIVTRRRTCCQHRCCKVDSYRFEHGPWWLPRTVIVTGTMPRGPASLSMDASVVDVPAATVPPPACCTPHSVPQ